MTSAPEEVTEIEIQSDDEEVFSTMQKANATINMKMLILHGYISQKK